MSAPCTAPVFRVSQMMDVVFYVFYINSQIQDKSIIFERLQITSFLLLLGQIRSLRSLTCIEDSLPCKTLVFSVFMFFAVLGCLIY